MKCVVTLETLRTERRDQVLRLAAQHGARSIRVFGSVARGEARDASDLDLLVDWEPGRSLLDHVALVQDLEELLGTRVHVVTERSSTGTFVIDPARGDSAVKDDRLYLHDMVERCRRIARFISPGIEAFMAAEELRML